MADEQIPEDAGRTSSVALTAWLLGIIIMILTAAAFLGADRKRLVEPARMAAAIYGTEFIHPPMRGVTATAADGREIPIACGTCHGADWKPTAHPALTHFHQDMHHHHGELSCQSCHDPDDGYQSLRLADGRRVAYADSMTLCAQCHGPQARDYARGAHGGMRGYWDVSRGPRERLSCTACHDPHAPAYPQLMPLPHANDRFLTPTEPHHD